MVLAISSVLLLVYEISPFAEPDVVHWLQDVDIFIALIFLADFCLGLLFTLETRKSYFAQNWINLIASIPLTSHIVQALRILRLIRAYRVFRAAMDVWQLARQLKRRR